MTARKICILHFFFSFSLEQHCIRNKTWIFGIIPLNKQKWPSKTQENLLGTSLRPQIPDFSCHIAETWTENLLYLRHSRHLFSHVPGASNLSSTNISSPISWSQRCSRKVMHFNCFFFQPQIVWQSLILAFFSSPYSLWSHHFELCCVKSYCLGYKSTDRIFIILRRPANFCVTGHRESLDKIHMY